MKNFTSWVEKEHPEVLDEAKKKKGHYHLKVKHGKLHLALTMGGEPVAVEGEENEEEQD